MARVKNENEASAVTILSKTRRWQRLKALYKVRKLDELFPPNSVPNNAGDDFLRCSGDVLRDMCLIGELLTRKGMSGEEMKNRVKNSFLPGVCVRHADVKELLERMKRGDVNAAKMRAEAGSFGGETSEVVEHIDSDGDEEVQCIGDEGTIEGASDPSTCPLQGSNTSNADLESGEKSSDQSFQVRQSIETPTPQHQPARGYFDITVEGCRRAKERAIAGITEMVDIDDQDDDADISEESDADLISGTMSGQACGGQQSTASAPAFPSTGYLRYHSSLRPMAEDGFADAYGAAALQGPPPKPPQKRKSAPGVLEHREAKRARLDSSASLPTSSRDRNGHPRQLTYMQSKHSTLVSCLKMTYTLVDGINRSLFHDDLDAVEHKAYATKLMVEQVLAYYGHSEDE